MTITDKAIYWLISNGPATATQVARGIEALPGTVSGILYKKWCAGKIYALRNITGPRGGRMWDTCPPSYVKVDHSFDGETFTTTYSIDIGFAVMPIKNVEVPINFVANVEYPTA